MEATITDIARSLLVIYCQMPLAVQEEFRRLIAEEEDTEWRMKITEETLREDEDWESPENDYWDELYAKLHGK